jgi:hypothetical protein
MSRIERPALARWIAIFVTAGVALMATVLLVLRVSNANQGLRIGTGGLIALVLGSTGTAVLGIVLMGLVFYSEGSEGSEGSGQDEKVYKTASPRPVTSQLLRRLAVRRFPTWRSGAAQPAGSGGHRKGN